MQLLPRWWPPNLWPNRCGCRYHAIKREVLAELRRSRPWWDR